MRDLSPRPSPNSNVTGLNTMLRTHFTAINDLLRLNPVARAPGPAPLDHHAHRPNAGIRAPRVAGLDLPGEAAHEVWRAGKRDE